jgi:hypothetical protein
MASRFDGKSLAEQRSVELAWSLLLNPDYKDLRNALCPTQAEVKRFRSLVVNAVMATDVMDKDLKELRNGRWDKAFSGMPQEDKNPSDSVNRKATIVIEHLIQASDIAHVRPTHSLFIFETSRKRICRPCNTGMCTGDGTRGCLQVR